MIKEAFGKGATNEEAIEAAKAELNAPWDADVQVELIKMAKKKTLGLFGGSLAEARAYYESHFGPLTAWENSNDCWLWTQTPWPWELEANC